MKNTLLMALERRRTASAPVPAGQLLALMIGVVLWDGVVGASARPSGPTSDVTLLLLMGSILAGFRWHLDRKLLIPLNRHDLAVPVASTEVATALAVYSMRRSVKMSAVLTLWISALAWGRMDPWWAVTLLGVPIMVAVVGVSTWLSELSQERQVKGMAALLTVIVVVGAVAWDEHLVSALPFIVVTPVCCAVFYGIRYGVRAFLAARASKASLTRGPLLKSYAADPMGMRVAMHETRLIRNRPFSVFLRFALPVLIVGTLHEMGMGVRADLFPWDFAPLWFLVLAIVQPIRSTDCAIWALRPERDEANRVMLVQTGLTAQRYVDGIAHAACRMTLPGMLPALPFLLLGWLRGSWEGLAAAAIGFLATVGSVHLALYASIAFGRGCATFFSAVWPACLIALMTQVHSVPDFLLGAAAVSVFLHGFVPFMLRTPALESLQDDDHTVGFSVA